MVTGLITRRGRSYRQLYFVRKWATSAILHTINIEIFALNIFRFQSSMFRVLGIFIHYQCPWDLKEATTGFLKKNNFDGKIQVRRSFVIVKMWKIMIENMYAQCTFGGDKSCFTHSKSSTSTFVF